MLWVKSFHIIAMVSWFAGLFYIPRFYVYHTRHESGPVHDQFCEMERKLYKYIMIPAMIVTAILGFWLAYMVRDYLGLWFYLKMALVVGLFYFHYLCGVWRIDFAEGKNSHPEKFYRMINEVPTLILIAAVILTVVKP